MPKGPVHLASKSKSKTIVSKVNLDLGNGFRCRRGQLGAVTLPETIGGSNVLTIYAGVAGRISWSSNGQGAIVCSGPLGTT